MDHYERFKWPLRYLGTDTNVTGTGMQAANPNRRHLLSTATTPVVATLSHSGTVFNVVRTGMPLVSMLRGSSAPGGPNTATTVAIDTVNHADIRDDTLILAGVKSGAWTVVSTPVHPEFPVEDAAAIDDAKALLKKWGA